ncbi:MAG: hypothetical protein JWN71_599 [Xanthobacteraceae bacterium]|nr:hypothetical protein [Xanthobacteraceae bacterium]
MGTNEARVRRFSRSRPINCDSRGMPRVMTLCIPGIWKGL